METIFPGMIIVIVLLGLYFLLAIIAAARHHRHCGALFLTNLLFGWIFPWLVQRPALGLHEPAAGLTR